MKNKYSKIIEKILFYVPLLTFILYTNVHYVFSMRSNSKLISFIINIFNNLYIKSHYIFIGLSLVLVIYIFINGSKRQKLITIATIVGCFFMCFNLTADSIRIGFSTVLTFVSLYLMGIVYIVSIFIHIKKESIHDIKKKIIKVMKIIVIYIGVTFLLSYISNTMQYSYIYPEQGLTGWIRSTNALGHALVFLLPLFILFHIKDEKNNYLFYIIVIVFLDIKIGTKACYFGLLSTLFIVILYLFIDFIKRKKYHYSKLISLTIILGFVMIINPNLYVTKKIEETVQQNTNVKGIVDITNTFTSGRYNKVDIIQPVFNDSNISTKVFGMGIYYPKFQFIYIELDLFDMLYSRGIYGLLLYVIFFGTIIVNMIIKHLKNIIKHFDIDYLLMFLTLFYIVFASVFVGHIVFNLMTITIISVIMVYYTIIINSIFDAQTKNNKQN